MANAMHTLLDRSDGLNSAALDKSALGLSDLEVHIDASAAAKLKQGRRVQCQHPDNVITQLVSALSTDTEITKLQASQSGSYDPRDAQLTCDLHHSTNVGVSATSLATGHVTRLVLLFPCRQNRL
jgi:hypothetical protein